MKTFPNSIVLFRLYIDKNMCPGVSAILVIQTLLGVHLVSFVTGIPSNFHMFQGVTSILKENLIS